MTDEILRWQTATCWRSRSPARATWCSFAPRALGSKLGLELVARERVVPNITRQPGGI